MIHDGDKHTCPGCGVQYTASDGEGWLRYTVWTVDDDGRTHADISCACGSMLPLLDVAA